MLEILRGSEDLLCTWDVLIARALADDVISPELSGAKCSALKDFMINRGYLYVNCFEERHPSVLQLFFVRNPKRQASLETERDGGNATETCTVSRTCASIGSDADNEKPMVVSRAGNNLSKDGPKSRSFSQLGQDLWALQNTDYLTGGYFVEVGAANGVELSNTCLLEADFGWEGIYVEPNPEFLKQLSVNRSCIISADCVGENTGDEVEFIFADVLGGISKYANDDFHKDKRREYYENGLIGRFTTITLADLLRKYEAPKYIDYLSLDIEGSEYDILSVFPFQEFHIRLITVEHNYTTRRKKIRELLENVGYSCEERDWDDWYVLGRD